MPRRLCLLVADHYTHSILRFDAGDDTFIDEFVPPSAELAFPMSVAVGPQGDIYAPSSGVFFPPPPPKIMGVLRFRGTDGAFAGVFVPHTVNDLRGPGDVKFGRTAICTSAPVSYIIGRLCRRDQFCATMVRQEHSSTPSFLREVVV